MLTVSDPGKDLTVSPSDFRHVQKAHHWILTLDGVGSYSGTCDWGPEETRYDLYLGIRSTILCQFGNPDGPVPPTLFFDIQANTLPPGASPVV